jgi:YVTN family beta-propeller protein
VLVRVRTSFHLAVLTGLTAIGACTNGTEPGPNGNGKTHPAGVVAASVPVGQRPYGISIAGSTAVLTQLDAAQIVRLDLTAARILDSIGVGSTPTGITVFANGTAAAVTNQADNKVEFLDLTSKTATGFITAPSTTFRVLQSLDEKHLYATASVGSVGVISLPGHSVEASIDVGAAPNGLALSPDGKTLYVTSMSGGITVISTTSNTVTRTIPFSGVLQDIAVSLNGSELYVADESSGDIHVLDANTGAVRANIAMGASVFGLTLSPDGKQIYATSASSGMLWIVDRAARTKLTSIPVGGTPRRIAFDGSGATAAVTNEAGFVTIVR